LLVGAGGLLLAGAIAAAAVELRGGSSAPAPVVTPDSVAVIDPKTNHVSAIVQVGARPVAVATGQNGVWVANADDGTVTRLDPKTRKVVATIGIGADVSDIAIGFGSVWVADGNDGSVTRIDPRLNAVETTLDFGPKTQLIPTPAFLIAVDQTHVWVVRGGELLRIDPNNDNVDLRVDVGEPIGLATGGGFVWVTTLTERLLRIDANTGALTSTTFPTQAIAPVFVSGSVWLIENLGRGEIERLDPNSLTATATASAGRSPTALAPDRGAVWVSLDDGAISRIDADSGNVTATAHSGKNPTSLAVGYGAIWITVATPGTT
jgi:YVTN family beta-propeller protein